MQFTTTRDTPSNTLTSAIASANSARERVAAHQVNSERANKLMARLWAEHTKRTSKEPASGALLKVHSELGAAVMRSGHVHGYGVWLLARSLDTRGAGSVLVADLRRFAFEHGALSGDRFTRALKQAVDCGLVTKRARRDGKSVVDLRSLLSVARLYDLRSVGAPVFIPALACKSAPKLKAALWCAWLENTSAPVSRAVHTETVGKSASTLRAYERGAGVTVTRNFAKTTHTGSRQDLERVAGGLRERGMAAFVIITGRKRKSAHVAVRLPNSYTTRLDKARRGNSRSVSRTLRGELVSKSGGVTRYSEPVFYESQEQAVAARARQAKRDILTPESFARHRRAGAGVGVQWWQVVSG